MKDDESGQHASMLCMWLWYVYVLAHRNLAIQWVLGVAIATEWMDEMVPCFLRMSINPCHPDWQAIIKGDRVSTCKLRHVVVSALGPQFMIPYWLLLYVISGVFTCFPTFHHGL